MRISVQRIVPYQRSTYIPLDHFIIAQNIIPKMSTELEERPNPAAADDGIEEDDDPPFLSSQALEALREFLSEQSSLGGAGGGRGDGGDDDQDEVRLVAEDWRLSQFWYDRETAETVAEEIRTLYRSTCSPIACIACPTLYAYLKVRCPFLMPVKYMLKI